MGHISPQAYRGMMGNMKNMSDNDIDNLKNRADPSSFNRANSTPFNSQNAKPSQENTFNKSQSINNNITNNNKVNKENTEVNLDDYLLSDKTKIALKKLESLKDEGNKFFKSSKFQEACEKYYEVLNELDYLAREQDINSLKDIEKLENTCRLNIATCKLKTNDNDLAINECLKILKKNTTNIKAHYKAGCGYINKKNYERALFHFEKVKEINPQEEIEQVKNYINECKKFLKPKEEDETNPDKKIQENLTLKNKFNSEPEAKPKKEAVIDKREDIIHRTIIEEKKDSINENFNTNKKKDKLKDVLEKELKPDQKINNKTSEDNEIIIEDKNLKITNNKTTLNDNSTPKIPLDNSYANSPNVSNNIFNNIDASKINQAKEQLKYMDENQMNNISNMFKNMDNNTIRSMYQMQGMNLTDEQINFMKNNINPNMMKMAAEINTPLPNTNSYSTNNDSNINNQSNSSNIDNNNLINENQISNIINNNVNNVSGQQQMPNAFANGFPNMDINSMMDFIQKNPNIMNMMGPRMSNMFGGANSGMDPNLMMNSMQTILWIMSLPTRIKQFFSSLRGKLLLLFLFILIISYFFR